MCFVRKCIILLPICHIFVKIKNFLTIVSVDAIINAIINNFTNESTVYRGTIKHLEVDDNRLFLCVNVILAKSIQHARAR